MADPATAVITNAAGTLVAEYASPYLSYFFRYGKIANDFKEKRKALQLKKERVENDVDEAKRQTEVIEKDVDVWRTSAEKELGEIQILEDEIDRIKCCKWCPNWGWRYSLSKKLAKKTLIISKLLETSSFPSVGRRPPLKGTDFITSEGFIDSESSKLAFNEIMEAINANDVNLIGVHGMPGVGKTTLAEEVLKHVEEQKMFNKVVMFTMSQTPNINEVQDKIANMLGFQFQSNTKEGKAAELRRSIKGQEKILVIVDDLWEEYKLQTIGIPFGNEHKGCKVLLTTRIQQVCAKMDCQKEIQLNILSKNEAWALFKDNAGLDDGTSTLNDVARDVAGECKGLPLAVVLVGKALRGKSLDGWRAANQRLKDSRHLDNEEVFGGVYKLLMLSYDYLKINNSEAMGNNIQSCFLLCSLFPEDYEIVIERLILYGIGVGLFSHIYSLEDRGREIGVAVRKLVNCGLLLEGTYAGGVKMHDVVRDFGHWLKSKGGNKLMVHVGLKGWPNMVESLECYTEMALWECRSLNNVPDKLKFSNLKTLFLTGYMRVPTTFFEEMKDLRFLYLEGVHFSWEGLKSLTNLRALICRYCYWEDLPSSSSFRNMGNLEILELFAIDNNIEEILEELMQLSTLKLLSLSSGPGPISFPPDFLSRFKSLQELILSNQNNLNLLELNSLSHLIALSLRASTNQCCQENFVFPRLQRYNIVVNDRWKRLGDRTLIVKDVSYSLSAFKELFWNVEKLSLKNVSGQNNIVPNLCKNRVNELNSLELDSCEDMKFLIDRTGEEQGPTVAFTNLVELDIRKMTCLKELCNGPPPISFFQKLERVKIEDCKGLQVVFQMIEKVETQTPVLLSKLTILKLGSLPVLESIWKLDPSHPVIASLQSLKDVTITNCNKLKTIFLPCLSQSLVHLQNLHIEKCQGLEQIVGFSETEEITENYYPFCWPKMKTIKIHNCKRLKYLFPVTLPRGLPLLDHIQLWYCPELIEVFNFVEETDVIDKEIRYNFPNLRELSVRYCPKITCFIAQALENHYPFCWPKLETVRIESCKRLKYLFPVTLSQGLPLLDLIDLWDCPELIEVFRFVEETDVIGKEIRYNFPNLRELSVRYCPKITCFIAQALENHYPLCCQKIKTVRIVGCERLKYLFPGSSSQRFLMLDLIKLQKCPELIRVFGSTEETNVIGNENVPNLRELSVRDCPKFTCFIAQAQLMEDLSLRNVGTSNIEVPTLNQDHIMIGNHEHVFQAQGRDSSFSNIKRLELWDLSELRVIWKDPAQVITLDNLTSLKLYDCKKLRYIFSPSTACSLSQLSCLDIKGCEELEGIILAKEDVPSSSNADATLQPVISFPNLIEIGIRNCKVLKSLFPLGISPLLPKLKHLYVTANSKLEQVFELEVAAERKITFGQLRQLILDGLPCLLEFCPKGYHFVFPGLYYLQVKECPKMTTGFFIDSEQHVHSITQETEGCATATTQNTIHDTTEELTPLQTENMNISWGHKGILNWESTLIEKLSFTSAYVYGLH